MGAAHSHTDESITNELLLAIIGAEHIPLTDPFWAKFLSHSFKPPTNRSEEKAFLEGIKPLCLAMTVSNPKTANFTTMLQYFIALSQELKDSISSNKSISDTIQWQCFNALFISRCYAKHLSSNSKEPELVRQFNIEATPQDKLEGEMKKEDTKPLLEKYILKLVDLVAQLPLIESTHNIHYETINNILALLSVQMFTTSPANELVIYKIMMENENAKALTFCLVERMVNQACTPANSNSSVLIGLASDLWSLLTWKSGNNNETETPLTTHSVLLLLILVNHCAGPDNPYRQALSQYDSNLTLLYKSLCNTLHREENTLLLYHLLHVNNNFKTFLLAQTDIENMVIPLLRVVYSGVETKCHHVYMALIILLILTEDPLFNKTVHNTYIKSVPWYTERVLPELSLGGLIILVTTRTVQYNLLRTRDKYLHTNCLAALANMSAQFVGLHPYVCQRIVGLFEILAKTYTRGNADFSAVEEALRIVLEVINSCLTHQLVQNTNLVYTLLYKKHIFEPFRSHEAFQDVIKNIDLVINYFTNKLSSEEESIDVNEVLSRVQHWAVQWPRDLITKFPDLKFKYVEDDKPEEFFIPYVWTLVSQETLMHWEPSVYKLT